MSALIEKLAAKIGLRDESNIIEKTTELMRLVELRSTSAPLQINEYGKIVLCIDLASYLLNIAFDKEQALKLSGLSRSQYTNQRRMFLKLLNLNQAYDIKDICLQLGLKEVMPTADNLFALYKNVIASQNADIDTTHPQYATMAVFQACRLLKKKTSKTRLLSLSNLRPTQWQQLEKQWERMIVSHKNNPVLSKLESKLESQPIENVFKKSTNPAIEDYEQWKSRILAKARANLEELQRTGNINDISID